MNTANLKFDIVPTDPAHPLGVEVWIDDQQLVNVNQLTTAQSVVYDFNDELEQRYLLKIVVKNKTPEHTKVDDQGNILRDSLVEINNFELGKLNIDPLIREIAIYRHDFNGSGSWVDNEFYNTVGCNGTISFDFSTPSYIWLLEKM